MIAVIGDLMLDRYEQGSVDRISPEAPVPVVKLSRRWSRPGGAGHVAACLTGLGSTVLAAGVVGLDAAGMELVEALQKLNVKIGTIAIIPGLGTIQKTRILAGNSVQVMRIDDEPVPETLTAAMKEYAENWLLEVGRADAVILSDYDKGTVSASFVRQVIDKARMHAVPIIVDPKKRDFFAYQYASVITPNHMEAEVALGRRLTSHQDFNNAASELRERLGIEAVVITRGSEGMTCADAKGVFSYPAHVRDVADVTGAGDTVVAVIAHVLARGGTVRDGCELASFAAGIAVSKPGAYVVSAVELQAVMCGKSQKIVDQATLANTIRQIQSTGKKAVFTNGCFDILHAGHLHSLRESRRHGDILVVGLNSDESIKKLKGEFRPVNYESDRAELLSGLSCVDFIVLFAEETPEQLIRALSPDVLAKGGDYREEEIAGAAYVKSQGGKVVLIPLVPGLSSTRLIQKSNMTNMNDAIDV
jgi:D-beta-D-heptose 7-phosphate kinase/D-beta-D-heptose 1-phosphate adenosyltransferase